MTDSSALTPKQKRFCEEYLKDFNATAAYQRAGYAVKSDGVAAAAGGRLLTNVKIQSYISELQNRRSQRTEITAERVLTELARIAFCDITDVVEFDSNRIEVKDSKKLEKPVTAAIAEIACVEAETATRDGSIERKVNTKIKMHNKMDALKQLTQYLGLTSDFNTAIATFKKYGLTVRQTTATDSGWEVVAIDADSTSATA